MITARTQNTAFITNAIIFVLALLAAVSTGNWYLVLLPFALLIFYAGWQNPALFFYLLLAALPFSAEMQVTGSLGTDFPDEPLMLLVSVLFFCNWICDPARIKKRALKHPLILLLLTGMCWAVIPVIFSTQPLISFKFLLAKLWYAGAFVLAPLILFRDKRAIRNSFIVLVSCMMLITLVTMIRHYFYGFSFAFINDALRPFFRNHVNYSALLVCMAPALLAMYKLTRNKRARSVIATAFLLLLIALFFSYSRGAWLALFTGFAGWWLIKRKWLVISFFSMILIAAVAVYWIKSEDRYLQYAPDYRTTIFHKDFTQHLTATYEMKDVSTAERFYRWIAGARMIKDNWLTGYGPGSFYYNYKPYGIPAYKTWVSDNKDHSTVHNYFLLLLIEQGVPALLFFLLLVLAMLYYAQYLYHRVATPLYKYIAVATGAVVVMLLTVNFLSDLIETDKIGSIFFLCLSLLVMTDINTRNELEPAPYVEGVS